MYFTIKCNIQPNNTLEITYTTKAKNRIKEEYSWESICDKYLEVFMDD